jgi:acetoin utilization protein AcuB
VRIEQLMTKKVVAVEMDDSLRMVKDIFDHIKFHHLLVVESGKLFGVISDRDVLKALSPTLGTIAETAKDTAILNKKAHQIMTRKPIVLPPEADVYEAIAIFNVHNVSCIPVVDTAQHVKGIVSWRDILKALAAKRKSTT